MVIFPVASEGSLLLTNPEKIIEFGQSLLNADGRPTQLKMVL